MEEQKYPIGSRIKHYRTLRGLTQKELATAVGYVAESSKTTINKIEAGARDVSQSKLPLFAKALGVSVLDLLGIEDSEVEAVPDQSSDEVLAYALYGDAHAVTPEDLNDIRKFADYVKARRKNG